ncbi:hypothetical protein SARC_07733 [Sphaeroforma arctica JP610]|uniref:DH domain-containing protein n=1 Tax=Sphaeroforma arctica JP610 TaxID=667725 RepID=A0A0L0FT69_9EUKA|nr:hypothetical protein SARC_07733 [Sphaeroforma arctica JP610]KNC79894.1 hypothetical protein SARC_07733 [Sphaeroforma arctica JP610]|eukprot:XP_014153796.1 hypothetical protein SARC_07733 [Sphaeroforma arctica JP610]
MTLLLAQKGRPNSTGSAFDSSARDRVNSRGKNAQTISDPALNHALDTASDMAGQEAGLSLKEMLQSVTRSNSRARRNTHDLYKNKKAQEQPRESAGSAIEPPPQQAPSIPKAKHPRKMSSTELLGMAIEEVVRTEEKYVDDLQTVFSVFEFLSATVDFGTLSDNPQTNADIQKCIAELKNMIDCHANFYAAIQAPQNATDESEQIAVSRLCSGFVAYADQFKSHYSSYCVLYPQVLAAWMPYESSPEAMAAVDQYKRENKVMSLNIQSLLIKPVQRLCKYHLLLGQLMKYAQNGSQSATAIVKTTDLAADPDAVVDMAELKACLAVMKNVGDEVNAIKQRKDMDDLSSDLFANVNGWEGLAATKVGPLLYNDTVTIDAHKSGKKISNASIYVFQNAVVICAPNTQARRKESTADNIKENSGKNRASRKNSSVVSRKNSVDFFPAYNFTAAPPSIPPLEDHEFTQAPLQHKTHAPLTSRSIASIKTPKKSTSQTTKSAKNIISDGSHHNLTHISSTYNITTYSSVSTTSTPLSGSSRRGSRRASTDGRDQYQTNTASKVGGSPKLCECVQRFCCCVRERRTVGN